MRVKIILFFLLFNITFVSGFETLIVNLPLPYEHFIEDDKRVYDSQKTLYEFQKPRQLHIKAFKESLPSRYRKTYEDFISLQILSTSVIMGLWLLPEDVSQWDHDKIRSRNIFNNWYENIKSGPVQDTDAWAINYIGHSLSGAYFYTLARNNGLTVAEATTFNFMMSTFYWEYGVEAFFEIPSAQDLWITPILGSLLGEQFYQWELKIRANEGKVWGSENFGAFILVLLNPEGALANFLRMRKDRISIDLVSRYGTYSKEMDQRHMMGQFGMWMESYIGYEIQIKF